MKKLTIILAIILVIAGLAYIFWPKGEEIQKSAADNITTQLNDKDNINNKANNTDSLELTIGLINAPVTITEYGDFKCPSCAKFYDTTSKELRAKEIKSGKAKIIFRNLPYIGPDSDRAAQGTYCANEQNVFTQYHDAVYGYIWKNYYQSKNYDVEKDDILTTELLVQLLDDAAEIDKEKFQKCIDDKKYNKAVLADLQASDTDGATGTPYFLIGSNKITGPQPHDIFKKLIDIESR